MKHHNASDFEKIVQKMLEVHKAKNNDYSPEGQFGNFAESERVGVPDWKGAFIRLQDKYTRCCNLIYGKEAQVKDEALEDTLLDLANYAVIVLVLRKQVEAQEQENEHCNRWWRKEPEYLYRHIPVTEQEDEEWENKAPSDVSG